LAAESERRIDLSSFAGNLVPRPAITIIGPFLVFVFCIVDALSIAQA
jgi:hypothetical protein